MKISFILASLALSGGERIIAETVNRLSQNGHDLTVVLPNGMLDPDIAKTIEPSVKLLQTKIIGSRKMSLFSSFKLTLALSDLVPISDVIITTYTPTTIAGFVASRILKRGKLVWLFMDFPEMFSNKPLYRWIANFAPIWHDCILTLSKSLKEEILARHATSKVIVTSLALSEEYYSIPESNVIENIESLNGKKTILYLGDKRPRKGLEDFLEAARIVYLCHPEIQLWVVLKDEQFIDCEITHQVFYRPANVDLAQLYKTCDVYVSATWREGFGMPPLEAMACGAAVVMTESGGGQEYSKDGENCLLVPPHSPEKLASAIIQIIEDQSLKTKLRKNGPLTAANFTWEKVMSRTENALVSLIQE